jgi:hypothetical protein
MAEVVYNNLVFPHHVGGPGPVDTVALTVTATGSSTDSNECLTQTDIVAYNAASAADKLRHDRFSDIVSTLTLYGKPTSIDAVTNNVITMRFERKGLFENSSLGKPGWFSYGHRPNMFDLCATYVAAESGAPHYVAAITITINGSAQSGT